MLMTSHKQLHALGSHRALFPPAPFYLLSQVSLPTATVDGPAPPVGALSSALSKLQSNRELRELREVAKVCARV